jgi:hypothetical protein
MTRGEVRSANADIDTENALNSITRAFPMTSVAELRIRRNRGGGGYEFEMMHGPLDSLQRFQLDVVPEDVGKSIMNTMKNEIFAQRIKTSEKLEKQGVVG